MYFSGNLPLIVVGTFPASLSRGLGTTLKLSADNAPNFEEQDDSAINAAAERNKTTFFCILNKGLIVLLL